MTETVGLRPLRVADAAEMTLVLSHPDLYAYTGGEPPSQADLEVTYAAQTRGRSADGTELWLNDIVVVGEDRRAVGYVQATIPLDGRPTELAWVIGRAWQGRGYTTRSTSLLVDQLREKGITQIVAHIHPDHDASARIASALGMVPTQILVDGETRWARTLG